MTQHTTEWLSGYKIVVLDLAGDYLTTYYAPTMAEGERHLTNDIGMGAFGNPPQVGKIICEWRDELLPYDEPAGRSWNQHTLRLVKEDEA